MGKTMINMVAHQCFFCIGDGAFYSLYLLRDFQTGPLFLQHGDYAF